MTKFYNPGKWISTLFMFYLSLCYISAANYLCFTSKETGITIKYIPSDKNNIPDITYSYDQEKWFPLSSDELILMLGENEKVYLRGKNPNGFSFSSDSFTKFSIDGNVEVSGSVMSLIDNEGESTEIPNEYCFYRLFEGCKIISAPELPATSLKPNCYRQMFWGCPIEKAPELPATKLAKSCYAGMMGMCTNLEETPDLPATELADSCYSGMFTFCSNLKKVVNLPAPTLAKGCYIEMFSFCSKLNYIKVGCPSLDYNDGSDNILSATKGWVQSIDGKGYFIFPCGSDYDTRGASAVPDNFDIIRYPITIFQNPNGDVLKTDTIECGTAPYYGEEPPFLDNEHEFVKWDKELNVLNEPGIYYYTAEYKDAEAPVTGKWLCFTAEEPESVVFYKSTGDNEPNVFYSYNGLKWYPLLYGEEIKLTNIGDKVYVKGNNPDGFSKDYDEYTTFFMYGSIAASGSVMSLIDGEGTTTKIPNDQCFIHLFEGCQSLTTAPELPATELTSKCYSHMFNGCVSLREAPKLPATTLEFACYESMFSDCISLKETPELPATNLASACYADMFARCTSITKAYDLPAEKLASTCYMSMFIGCSSLVEAPALPAIVMESYCYSQMFLGCTSLTKAPELPATTLETACYDHMFGECSNLKYIKVGVMSLDNEVKATYNWVNEVDEKGVFIFPCGSKYNKYGSSEVPYNFKIVSSPIIIFQNPDSTVLYRDTISCDTAPKYYGEFPPKYNGLVFKGWDVEPHVHETPDIYYYTAVYGDEEDIDLDKILCFTAEESNCTISYNCLGNPCPDLQFSVDSGKTWKSMEDVLIVELENVGDKVYIRGNNPTGFHNTKDDYFHFTMKGLISASGSVMSLLDMKGELTEIPCDYCFNNLFINCPLTQAPDLPATVLTKGCYKEMFKRCYFLQKAPELPAETVKDESYEAMFNGCSSLSEMPKLPATRLGKRCYYEMFVGCTNLTKAYDLPAKKLETACYAYMFTACSKLEEAPALPATELADSCYCFMFLSCENLTKAPELPATTLKTSCYDHMFTNCQNLETVPDLKATVVAENCCNGMFLGCTYLRKAPALPAKTLERNCYYTMFAACVNLKEAPELPATTLAEGCYNSMFGGCMNLGKAPELPATNLADECYSSMFAGCTSLNYIKVGLMTLDNEFNATDSWVGGVEGPGVFVFPCGSKYNKHGASEVPDKFKIVSSPIVIFQNPDSTVLYSDTINCGDTPKYEGKTPKYGDGLVWDGWDKPLEVLDDPDVYYYTAVYKEGDTLDLDKLLCFTAEEAGSEIFYMYIDKTGKSLDVQYSINEGETWHKLERNQKITLENVGDKIYLKGNNPNGLSNADLNNNGDSFMFGMDGKIAASGSIMSLIDGKGETTVIPCDNCFEFLFIGNKALTQAPELPATNLTVSCYSRMFEGCSSLTKAPKLPAKDLARYCYFLMFDECTSLTQAPELPASKLADGCYMGMFEGCTSLTQAPELPASKLAESCYTNMFGGCRSLIKNPELPATELAAECYNSMFAGCSSLANAPELPATELTYGCYSRMFEGCSKLDTIKVGVMTLDNEFDATVNWVDGIDGPGIFIFPCGSKYDKHGVSEVPDNFKIIASPIVIFQNPDEKELWRDTIGCDVVPEYPFEEKGEPFYKEGLVFKGWDIEPHVHETPDTYYYTAVYEEDTTSVEGNWLCFTAEAPESEIWYHNVSNQADIQYSIDEGKTWKTLDEEEKVTLNNIGDKVYFKGNNPEGFSHGPVERTMFHMSGQIAASGSVMSLIDGEGKTKVIPNDYCFSLLFWNCDALTQAPKLPATTLTKACYDFMFQDCINLTEAPELPATKIYDKSYVGMFMGCRNLKKAPTLPATEMKYRCYDSMFRQCTSLETPPALPAKELEQECYHQMFAGCTNLTQAPELPATKMAVDCYSLMFEGCENLKIAPKLPATELAPACYHSMFAGCTNLTQAPELPATKLDSACYSGMFYLCSALEKAPELPAKTLAKECYTSMFIECSSLTKAPELPATTLDSACYEGMFYHCTTLEKAPELPAKELADMCYKYMFFECTNLNYIKVGVMTLDNEIEATERWVDGIDGSGTFIFPCGSTYNKHGVSEVPDNFKIVSFPIVIFQNPDSTVLYRDTINCGDTPKYEGETPEYGDGLVWDGWDKPLEILKDPDVYYYTAVYKEDTASAESNWLCFTAEAPKSEIWYYNSNNNPDVQYSIDGGKTWKTLEEGEKVTLENIDDKVYFKGNNPEGFSHGMVDRSGFKMSGLIKASGSVMSLVDGVGKSKVIPNDYCFSALFNRCEALTQAPELPATTLTKACYEFMFQDCINLTEAPKLPATKIYDKSYVGMFMGCHSLKNAPALPATEMKYRCYDSMFRQCTSLETPPALPAKELAEECYHQMFHECYSLNVAPELPATKMANDCYSLMLNGCIKLTTAPKLPATELAPACYYSMFGGCIGLTEAPELPATTLDSACYSGMFYLCSALTEAPELPATTLAEGCYSWMFDDCSSLIKAPALPATELAKECYMGMFLDCTSLEKVPELPATKLAKGCYMGMFMSCTSLEKAPELPATEFADSCYIYMFKECTNLNYIKVGVMTLDNEVDATKDWVEGVDKDGIFIFPCGSTYDKHGYSEVPPLFEIIGHGHINDSIIIACDSIVFDGITYYESKEWNDTISTIDECDSIIAYHLIVNKSIVKEETIYADQSFIWHDMIYTEDASWDDSLTSVSGCDSVIRYNLIINKSKLNLDVRDDDMILILPGDEQPISYILTGGKGSQYEIRDKNKLVCSGEVANDSSVNLICPNNMEPGLHTVTMEMCDEEGNCAKDEFEINVMKPDDKQKSYYVRVWNDVVICRNGDGQFLSYQWYKDGKKVEDASLQYFNDISVLDGEYMVFVSDKDGKSYFIEPIHYEAIDAAYSITATPGIVDRGKEFTLTITGVEANDLQNARIVVYRVDGTIEKILNNVEAQQSTMQLRSGDYVIVLTVNDGKNANCKVLVK